ncbi:MAG: hypothetical protein IT280_05680 [Ignavibacteria bacterium]|nr:hypothetical protein [Ignavibacteria bacterium]
MKTTASIFFIFNIFLSIHIFSQCSDAGVCIIGKHTLSESIKNKNLIYFGANYGYTGKDPDINGSFNDISIVTFRVETDFSLGKEFRFNASVPYSFINGPLGENNGLGDFEAVISKTFNIHKKLKLTFLLGGKLALGKVNSKDSLPQRYMPGLGTNDLIAGAMITGVNYYFGIGYQKPFGRSANYVTRLKRGDDAFFRAGFYEVFNKISIRAEILTILRVQPSSVLTAYTPETFTKISNSNETQVNLLANLIYQASENISLTAEAVLPLLKRDYNIDGLKRKLSFRGAVGYNF